MYYMILVWWEWVGVWYSHNWMFHNLIGWLKLWMKWSENLPKNRYGEPVFYVPLFVSFLSHLQTVPLSHTLTMVLIHTHIKKTPSLSFLKSPPPPIQTMFHIISIGLRSIFANGDLTYCRHTFIVSQMMSSVHTRKTILWSSSYTNVTLYIYIYWVWVLSGWMDT